MSRAHNGSVSATHVVDDADTNSFALTLLENASGVVRVLMSKGFTIDAWDPATA